MPEFPGFITRQALIDFARNKSNAAAFDADSAFTSMFVQGLTKEDVESLQNSYSMHLGKQQAYRDVCEWAKKHNEPDIGAQQYGAGHA